jgi:hypothetical protein
MAGATPQSTIKEIISRILVDLLKMGERPKSGLDYITSPSDMSAKTEGHSYVRNN